MASLTFQNKQGSLEIKVPQAEGLWLATMLETISVYNHKLYSLQEVKDSYEQAGIAEDFELFWDNKPINTLHTYGLLTL